MATKIFRQVFLLHLMVYSNGQNFFRIVKSRIDFSECVAHQIFNTDSVTECVLKCSEDSSTHAVFGTEVCSCIDRLCFDKNLKTVNDKKMTKLEVFRQIEIKKNLEGNEIEETAITTSKPKGTLMTALLKLSKNIDKAKLIWKI